MNIKELQGHRWFIWTLVFLVVSGVGLVTYINYTSSTASEGDVTSTIALVHHAKPLTSATMHPAKTKKH